LTATGEIASPYAPIYYSGTSVNSAKLYEQSTEQPGQVMATNIGQTVELLLNPGNGSGPLPSTATFQTVIKPQYLLGPLSTRKGYAEFIKALRSKELYVLVQTNNSYDSASGASSDGNFPNGELQSQKI
jgi:hypothetical protein